MAEHKDPIPGTDVIGLVVLRPEHMDPLLLALFEQTMDVCSSCGEQVAVSPSGQQQREAWAQRGGQSVLHCCCCAKIHSVEGFRDFLQGKAPLSLGGQETYEYHVHEFADGVCACGMKESLIVTSTNDLARHMRDESSFDPDNIQDI